jgi:hypothetical protein
MSRAIAVLVLVLLSMDGCRSANPVQKPRPFHASVPTRRLLSGVVFGRKYVTAPSLYIPECGHDPYGRILGTTVLQH